jgi:hypothetical protein
MNKLFQLLTLYFFLFFANFACQQEQEVAQHHSHSKEKPIDSALQIHDELDATFDEIKRFADYSVHFQEYMQSLEGLFRGLEMNVSIETVRLSEKGELRKNTLPELIYKIQLSETDFATVNYKFKNQRLQVIESEAKIIANEQYQILVAELIDYYSKRFGEPKINPKGQQFWNVNERELITISYEKIGEQYLIFLRIEVL